ncbi:Rha family transcriptional regulator [uncultured Desulfovibrio sp.]|uniref:Rha family transcriptional regulator n=1 Tax=uncultured Desulfovibrio sp. TaxID=167968 RepID=UPI00261BB4B7|nr:Rha family transcriptional regulator [uncultured Desulfovibrio sp.]
MSQPCFPIPASDGISFRSLGAAPAVLSTDVARHFQKKHCHVLREIDRLRSILPKSFHEPNFGLMFNDVKIGNGGSRKEKAYLLTRDALSLLVMGFTGKAAIVWKLRYIEAFNDMEARLRDMAALGRRAPSALPEQGDMLRRVYALGPAKKRRLRAIVRYRRMGLGKQAIARLLDCHGREVSALLKTADALGWLPPAPPRPARGNLLEVGHEQ